MKSSQVRVCLIAFIVVVCVQTTIARSTNYRTKRFADNHLADLETKIALNNKFKGVVVTMPIGGGRIDPFRVGRKRRSDSRMLDILFNQSAEDEREENLPPQFRNNELDYTDFLHRFSLK